MNAISFLGSTIRTAEVISGATYYSSGLMINANFAREEIIHISDLVHNPSGYVYFLTALTLAYGIKTVNLISRALVLFGKIVKWLKDQFINRN